MTLAEILKKAFAEEIGPTGQIAGYDFKEEEHEVLGDVPIAVQWLHELNGQLTNDTNALVEQARQASGTAREELVSKIQSNRNILDTLNHLKWKVLEDTFSIDEARHSGLAILKGWKAAATLKSAEEPSEFPDFLKALLSGEGLVIGVMGMGPSHRPRRHDA